LVIGIFAKEDKVEDVMKSQLTALVVVAGALLTAPSTPVEAQAEGMMQYQCGGESFLVYPNQNMVVVKDQFGVDTYVNGKNDQGMFGVTQEIVVINPKIIRFGLVAISGISRGSILLQETINRLTSMLEEMNGATGHPTFSHLMCQRLH
jgi:hypothetical protein